MTNDRYDIAVKALQELEAAAKILRQRINSHPNLDADYPHQKSMMQDIGDLTLQAATALGCLPDMLRGRDR